LCAKGAQFLKPGMKMKTIQSEIKRLNYDKSRLEMLVNNSVVDSNKKKLKKELRSTKCCISLYKKIGAK
jgi:hypothetical protein